MTSLIDRIKALPTRSKALLGVAVAALLALAIAIPVAAGGVTGSTSAAKPGASGSSSTKGGGKGGASANPSGSAAPSESPSPLGPPAAEAQGGNTVNNVAPSAAATQEGTVGAISGEEAVAPEDAPGVMTITYTVTGKVGAKVNYATLGDPGSVNITTDKDVWTVDVKVNATSVTPAISVTGSGPLTCSAAVNGQTVDAATSGDAVACSGLYDAATGAGASQGY